jgi:hypothetical protein
MEALSESTTCAVRPRALAAGYCACHAEGERGGVAARPGRVNADDTAGFVAQWDAEYEPFTITGSQMDATAYRVHKGIRPYRQRGRRRCPQGKGRGSGVLVEQRIGIVWRLLGDKIRHCRA